MVSEQLNARFLLCFLGKSFHSSRALNPLSIGVFHEYIAFDSRLRGFFASGDFCDLSVRLVVRWSIDSLRFLLNTLISIYFLINWILDSSVLDLVS